MGTVVEKLSYLADTKDLFKDRLNSLGAEIIESTTFRNYLNWLDNFYIGSANKTDLAKNGVVGRTNQDGEPTPENPVEINNLSGDVEYKVRGKNLFDINNALNNNLYNQGTSLSLITNGIRATTEAVSNYRMGLIKIGETNKLIGKTIRLKANFSSNGNNNGRFYIGYCDASGGNRVPKSDTTTSGDTLSMVVESGSGENICLALYSNNNGTNYTIGNYVDYKNIIMTVGNEDMTYEPYISESFPLSLGDIELCKIGDYQDSIVKDNGKWFLHKEIGKVVFDGSESWTINTSYTYNVFYRTLDNYARISNAQTTYCEYYKGIENAGGIAAFGNNYNNSIGVRTANDNIKDIYISNNSITSASDFKTWLSTHNTVVYYVLATPTTTEITQENYPTLYSQLLAIQEFLTKYKINKEFLLDYSSPEIEY